MWGLAEGRAPYFFSMALGEFSFLSKETDWPTELKLMFWVAWNVRSPPRPNKFYSHEQMEIAFS